MISKLAVLRLVPDHPTPEITAAKLQSAAVTFGVMDPRSQAAALANAFVESGLVPKREDLYYTTPSHLADVYPGKFKFGGYNPADYVRNPVALANLVYALRLGNGSVTSGDGYAFRGGGYPQLTGRGIFTTAAGLIGQPIAEHPELIEQIGVSSLALFAYWTHMSQAHACALRGDLAGTRRCVNGPALLGLGDMLAAYRKVLPLIAS